MRNGLLAIGLPFLISFAPRGLASAAALDADQAEAIEWARKEGDNFEWAVMTKVIGGATRTVVILGQGFVTFEDDFAIARRVIDRFERFAVELSGPYPGRPTPSHEPREDEPMEYTARGARTKSVENAEQFRRWGFVDYADVGLLGLTASSGLLSVGYFVQLLREGPGTRVRSAVMGGLLAGSAAVFAARIVCPTCFPLNKSRAASMAEYIDRWMKERGDQGPLVLVVRKRLFDEVKSVLERRYFFAEVPS